MRIIKGTLSNCARIPIALVTFSSSITESYRITDNSLVKIFLILISQTVRKATAFTKGIRNGRFVTVVHPNTQNLMRY